MPRTGSTCLRPLRSTLSSQNPIPRPDESAVSVLPQRTVMLLFGHRGIDAARAPHGRSLRRGACSAAAPDARRLRCFRRQRGRHAGRAPRSSLRSRVRGRRWRRPPTPSVGLPPTRGRTAPRSRSAWGSTQASRRSPPTATSASTSRTARGSARRRTAVRCCSPSKPETSWTKASRPSTSVSMSSRIWTARSGCSSSSHRGLGSSSRPRALTGWGTCPRHGRRSSAVGASSETSLRRLATRPRSLR